MISTSTEIAPLDEEKAIRRLRLVQLLNVLTPCIMLGTLLIVAPAVHLHITDQVRYIMSGVFVALLPINLILFEIIIRARKKKQSWGTEQSIQAKKW